jgi:hypothetical protein
MSRRAVRNTVVSLWMLLLPMLPGASIGRETTVTITTPMSPPAWALLERELLRANSRACEFVAAKYLDPRGYLLHTPRWGVVDGPDDAIETFARWPLLHALGGEESVLQTYKRAQEGHWLQYGEMRTTKTDLAKDGAYYREFITMSDLAHTMEGMQSIISLGLSEPDDDRYRIRMKRFAGLYMNEDPAAPNYDPVHKVIRSAVNGSKGPMLRKPTIYDWVGDPVSGMFHFIHSSESRNQMHDFASYFPKMVATRSNYGEVVGDSHLNLISITLALEAYMLAGERKYKDWILEYVGAWKERIEACGGNIPTKVGLDGKPDAQWWKGVYGWNFTVFDVEANYVHHRGSFASGPWTGFGNALLLTGDQGFIQVLRRQMDNIFAQKKVVEGKTVVPQAYGDPRGYEHTGPPEWYHWAENPYDGLLTEIYLWSMDRNDLARISPRGWLAYLEGKKPDYPEEALRKDLAQVRRMVDEMKKDPTTPDSRLADWVLLGFPQTATEALMNLMLGGYSYNKLIWPLHSRVRYFDPVRRRAGVPEDVAALVDQLTADSMSLTLVNVNQLEPRIVTVQAGAYGEHQFTGVQFNSSRREIDHPFVNVRLEPGCGARLVFDMTRYANQPTLAHPWTRN